MSPGGREATRPRSLCYVRGKRVRTIKVKPWSRFNVTFGQDAAACAQSRWSLTVADGPGAKVSRLRPAPEVPLGDVHRHRQVGLQALLGQAQSPRQGLPDRNRPGEHGDARARDVEDPRQVPHQPGSVYGPRKMRLFRQRGGGYAFSAYGIHGTNQPW